MFLIFKRKAVTWSRSAGSGDWLFGQRKLRHAAGNSSRVLPGGPTSAGSLLALIPCWMTSAVPVSLVLSMQDVDAPADLGRTIAEDISFDPDSLSPAGNRLFGNCDR